MDKDLFFPNSGNPCSTCHLERLSSKDTWIADVGFVGGRTTTIALLVSLISQQNRCAICKIIAKGIVTWFKVHAVERLQNLEEIIVSVVALKGHPIGIRLGWEKVENSRSSILFRSSDSLEFYIEAGQTSSVLAEYIGSPHLSFQRSLDSQRSCEIARKWIWHCLNEHPKCRLSRSSHEQASRRPSRIIEVGLKDSAPRLIDFDASLGPYVTLSHRWSSSGRMASTIQSNLESRKVSMEVNELPEAFQDALEITSNLGVRFLWIDSLCIVQDSKAEWDTECLKMADIYQNCFLTIASNRFQDEKKTEPLRCFNDYYSSLQTVCMDIPLENSQTTRVLVGKPEFRPTTHIGCLNGLFGRGWVFQEVLLTPRVLEYSSPELKWHCMELDACACCPESNDRTAEFIRRRADINTLMTGIGQENGVKCFEAWSRLIYDYSSLEFTFESDILPALSGIAALYHRRFGGVYLAGMWKESLPRSLLWCRQKFLSQKDRPYLVPTWSWASSTANLLPDCLVLEALRSPHSKDIAYVKDVQCHVSGINSYGNVLSGFLILEAPLLAVKIKLHDKHHESGYTHFSIVSPPISCPKGRTDWHNRLDYLVEEKNLLAFEDDDHWLLSLAIISGWNHKSELYGLLLRRSPRDPNSFERIAMYKCYLRRRILWSRTWNLTLNFGLRRTVKIL